MHDDDRAALRDLRAALLALHKILLDWERLAYERLNGRTAPAELLRIITTDRQFAWLRPLSELIIRMDVLLEPEGDESVDAGALVIHARNLVAPDEAGTPYARRYHAALQELPDAVLAHRRVTTALMRLQPRETLH
jgi:hypothetical protein